MRSLATNSPECLTQVQKTTAAAIASVLGGKQHFVWCCNLFLHLLGVSAWTALQPYRARWSAGLPTETVQLDSDFQELGGSRLSSFSPVWPSHSVSESSRVQPAPVGRDSLLMGRASSTIKKAFGLATFKGTTVYQLGTVRRILTAC